MKLFNKPPKAKFSFELGDKVKDKITGFEGLVIRRTQWLNACNTYGAQSTALKDGLPQEAQNFDEPQLTLVEEKVIEPKRSTGGPQKHIPQANRE